VKIEGSKVPGLRRRPLSHLHQHFENSLIEVSQALMQAASAPSFWNRKQRISKSQGEAHAPREHGHSYAQVPYHACMSEANCSPLANNSGHFHSGSRLPPPWRAGVQGAFDKRDRGGSAAFRQRSQAECNHEVLGWRRSLSGSNMIN
jgi:hypothetical protein